MKKIFFTLIAAMLVALCGAQQLPFYNQNHVLPMLYNPAMTGISDDVSIHLLHRSMWKDIPGAPVTSTLAVDGPIREKNIGLGMLVSSDVTDITQRLSLSTAYSYRLLLDNDNTLRFGLMIGLLDNKIDFSKAVVLNENDPYLLTQSSHRTSMDANAGVMYQWKDLQVGISVPQLLGGKLALSDNQASAYYSLSRQYTGSVKYSVIVNKDKGMTVFPIIMFGYVQHAPLQYDLKGVFDWENRGWAAISYHSNYAISMNIGFKLHGSLKAGYAYDYAVGPIKAFAGGAHEILLGYTFGRREESKPQPVGQSEDLMRKDLVIDSLLAASKANKENQERIEKMQKEIDMLKVKQDSLKNSSAASGTGSVNNAPVFSAKASRSRTEYKNSAGATVEKGYYIIMGSFGSKSNAEKVKASSVKEGFGANIMFSEQRQQYSVYLFVTPNNTDAVQKELGKVRTSMPDSWVLELTD